MPVIKIQGNDLYFAESSSKDAHGSLVFVHGAGGDHKIWDRLLNILPPGFTGFAVDLPGHNQSAGDPCTSVADYSSAVADFLLALNLPRPIIPVGHSMGGAVTLHLALNSPELIDGLVMVGSGARLQVLPQFLEQLESGIMDGKFLDLGFASSASRQIKEEFLAYAAQVPVTTFFKDFTACSRFDVRDQLDQLTVPLQLLVGAEDRLTPPKLSAFICEKIAGAHMTVISNAGHFVMLEQPEILSQEIAKFAAKIQAQT